MAEYPRTPIPLSDKPLTFVQAAIWYLRVKLLYENGSGEHTCPRCGGKLKFHNGKVESSKNGLCWVAVSCPNCKTASDRCEYPEFNYSPIELANGAMTRALKEFERKVTR